LLFFAAINAAAHASTDKHRPNELLVEGIEIPLQAEQNFKKFDKVIPRWSCTTLVGRYFAGRQIKYLKETPWGGHEHMDAARYLQ
jgi:hypothetical protein